MRDIDIIRKKAGRLSYIKAPRAFLDTGSTYLNRVLGREKEGLVYGKIHEIAGMPSNGKTLLLIDLAAMAQKDGAHIIWFDSEYSFDPDWVASRGLECTEDSPNFTLVQNYVVQGKPLMRKSKKTGRMVQRRSKKTGELLFEPGRLVFGEELVEECEALMEYHHNQGKPKMVVVIDSVAAILPEDEGSVGMSKQHMGTDMSLSKLLSKMMRKWVGLAATYNAMVLLINQLRMKPASFGDPSYTMGGNGIPFYAHVRVRVNRGAKSRMKSKGGRVLGIKAIMVNTKNKAGGVEGDRCAAKFFISGHAKFAEAKGSDE